MANPTTQQLQKKLSRNLILMGRTLAPDAFGLPTPDFHYDVAAKLQDTSLKRLCLQWPRDHAKSTLGAELLPIWHLFFQHVFEQEKRQTRFVVLISKSQREAKRRLRTVKSILSDDSAPIGKTPFTDLLGDWGEDTAQKWTDEEVVLKDGSTIISTGWSQQGRGLKAEHQRPSLIVVDDPEDEQNTKTDESMEANLEWMLSAIEPATSVDGRCILIGTPIRQRSLVRVMHDMDDWTSIKYKAIREEDGERTALWPDKWSVEELMEKRTSMRAIGREELWYKEYQCQLIQGEDSPITTDDFKYFDGHVETVDKGPITRHFLHVTHRGRTDTDAPDPLPEEETIPVTVTMGVDPASSTSSRADYSTIVVVAWTDEGDAYVLDYFRERVPPLDHADAIIDYYKRFRPQRARVEPDGYQRMLRDYLQDPRHFDVTIPGLAADETAGSTGESKVDRHLGLQFLFSRGHVHVQPHMSDFRDEWVLMDDAAHDDLRDGFWWAHRCKLEPSHSTDLLDEDTIAPRVPKKDPMVA
jgi:hypothetical protein